MTWDGGSSPRKSGGRHAITLRMSAPTNASPRVQAFLRDGAKTNMDISKNIKGKTFSSNGAKCIKKSNSSNKRKGKTHSYKSDDISEQLDIIGWCSTHRNDLQNDSDSDDLSKPSATTEKE